MITTCKVMPSLMTAIVLLVTGCGAPTSKAEDESNKEENPGRADLTASDCDGPSDQIKLSATAEQRGSETVVELSFESETPIPVRSLTLGDGQYHEWKTHPAAAPKEVKAPNGWQGKHVLQYEGPYQYLLWQPVEAAAPLTQLAGLSFTIATAQMPAMDLPFRVRISARRCIWSRWSIAERRPR